MTKTHLKMSPNVRHLNVFLRLHQTLSPDGDDVREENDEAEEISVPWTTKPLKDDTACVRGSFTSCHVMSCHVMSCHVMSCHVTSRHVTSRHVTSRHVTSRHVTSRHVTSHHQAFHSFPEHYQNCKL